MLTLILLVLAFVLFLVAAFSGYLGAAVGRVNLIALGLACWVLAMLLGGGVHAP